MQAPVEDTTPASWHSSSVEDALEDLSSSVSGLSSAEAATRLVTYGPNQLTGAPPVSALKLLLDEFRSPLVLVLIGAAAVLVGVALIAEESDHYIDAGLIALIVVLNACLGFTQNYRASRGIEALNRLAAPSATVLRDGVAEQVDAKVLVPGDIVLLEEGSRIPADGRVISSIDLSVDEAALTGESLPVRKSTQPVSADASLAERFCMAYSGTVVMRGRGRVLITRTGMQTEVGGIAAEVQTTESEPTVFQREISRLAARIGWAVAVLIGIVVVLQLVTGDLSLLETFITAVALAVAAVPEGLPVVLTLALAFGTRRMLERKALVRSLPVVEIVGAAEVICTDKTGTVTEGRMTMRRVATLSEEVDAHDVTPGTHGEPLAISLLIAGLCNNAHRHPEYGYVGDPTETALLEFAERAGAPLEEYERTGEVPFTSERRMMSVAVQHPIAADGLLLTKGALEAVLPALHEHPDAGRRVAAQRGGAQRTAGAERRAGGTGAAGAGARVQGAARQRPDGRGGADVRGAGSDERPAEAGGHARHRGGAPGRHPRGDDHGRQQPHRGGDRPGSGVGRRGHRGEGARRAWTTRSSSASSARRASSRERSLATRC